MFKNEVKWIKLTECLPKTDGDYLLTIHERYSYGTEHEVDAIRTVPASLIRLDDNLKWTFRDYFDEICIIDNEHKDYGKDFIKLIAWAEMPAPYDEHSVEKIAKRAETHNLYICPECNRFIERFEHSHGHNEIKHCKWCGCKMVYEADSADDIFSKPLEYLDLSSRAFNAVRRHLSLERNKNKFKITVGDVTEMTVSEIKHIRNLGVKSLNDIIDKLGNHGLQLKQEKV